MKISSVFIFTLVKLTLIVLLGSLEFFEKGTLGGNQDATVQTFSNFVVEKRFWVMAFLAFCLGSWTLWDTYNPLRPRKQARNYRHKIMDAMLEHLFQNEKNNVRITILKDMGFRRKLLINIKRILRWQKPIWNSYICVWDRLSNQYKDSKTFFYFNPQTNEGCQGVAGCVRQMQREIVADNLPDIRNIDLNESYMNVEASDERKLVDDYMKRGYITDLETLKRLNRRALHIYGNILLNANGEPKGVLVIDSLDKESPFKSAATKKNLQYYAKLLGTTM